MRGNHSFRIPVQFRNGTFYEDLKFRVFAGFWILIKVQKLKIFIESFHHFSRREILEKLNSIAHAQFWAWASLHYII